MANTEFVTDGGLESLQARLRDLETAGLPKPSNCLLTDYLRFLVDHDLLPADVSADVESLYHNSRYGHGKVSAELLTSTVAQLDAALDHLRSLEPAQRDALAEELSAAHDSGQCADQKTHRPWVRSPMAASIQTADFPSLAGFTAEAEQSPVFTLPQSERRLGARGIAVGIVWTIAAVAVGYFGHDKVSPLFHRAAARKQQTIDVQQVRHNHRMNMADRRKAILAADTEEERAQMMRDLALMHLRRREYAEYYFLYELLSANNAGNADDKYTAARFLLKKSRDNWYHNPVRARQLAEEAVAADPQPYHLDALAEAMFQTGEPARAVEIEQQALAADVPVPPNWTQFFKDQLKRFQQAVHDGTTSTAEAATPAPGE